MLYEQDMEGAMTPKEVNDHLGLDELKGRSWQIFSTSAITGQGLQEGLDWYPNIFCLYLEICISRVTEIAMAGSLLI